MNKLICSTFAMSLMVLPLEARELGLMGLSELEAEILPELSGPQKFTSPWLHQQPEWRVREKVLATDKWRLKGQSYSLIPWKSLDPVEWLSVDNWLIEQEIKGKHPDWKLRLREERQLELVGKMISCKGECPILRGTMPASGQYLSRLLEGDEIRTERDSEAWIFLMDGTLVRLGPESSLSFQEINLGKEEIFILARLNKGHVYWGARPKEEYPLEFGPETDALALPLMILESNRQHFEREIFKSQNDHEQLAEVMELNDSAIKAQIKRLNELRLKHNNLLTIPTKIMMVAPNITLVGGQVSFDLVYVPGGVAYFKKKESPEGNLTVHLRGYTQTQTILVTENMWHEAAQQGRSFYKMSEVPGALQLLELITKRIKTLELAREIWISQYSIPVLSMVHHPKLLATEHGYSAWEAEKGEKRFEFLTEYTRRIETTNMRSIDNLLQKIDARGDPVNRAIGPDLYEHALNHYLKGLKTRYTSKRTQVREMNDLQYYVWALKNGKL